MRIFFLVNCWVYDLENREKKYHFPYWQSSKKVTLRMSEDFFLLSVVGFMTQKFERRNIISAIFYPRKKLTMRMSEDIVSNCSHVVHENWPKACLLMLPHTETHPIDASAAPLNLYDQRISMYTPPIPGTELTTFHMATRCAPNDTICWPLST